MTISRPTYHFLGIVFLLPKGVFCQRCEYFKDDDDPSEGLTHMYCETGCCGDRFDRECCKNQANVTTIVLIVLGGLLALVTIFCVVSLVICIRRKRRENNRQGIRATGTTGFHQNAAFTEAPPETAHVNVTSDAMPPSYEEAVRESNHTMMLTQGIEPGIITPSCPPAPPPYKRDKSTPV